MADDHARLAFESRQAAHNCGVIGKCTVAVQFVKIGENQVDVVERVRALRMTRDFDHLPRFEFGVGVFGQFIAFFLQASDFF